MNTDETKTPRTDAADTYEMLGVARSLVPIDFARTLETELQTATATIARLTREVEDTKRKQYEAEGIAEDRRTDLDATLAKVAELERERDTWKEHSRLSEDQLAARDAELAEVRAERSRLLDVIAGIENYGTNEEVDLRAELATAKQQRDEERADFQTLLQDANRSREIIYEMSDALQPEPGEHNIDAAKRVVADRDRLAAENDGLRKAAGHAKNALTRSLIHHGCDPCHIREAIDAIDAATAELAKQEEQK